MYIPNKIKTVLPTNSNKNTNSKNKVQYILLIIIMYSYIYSYYLWLLFITKYGKTHNEKTIEIIREKAFNIKHIVKF